MPRRNKRKERSSPEPEPQMQQYSSPQHIPSSSSAADNFSSPSSTSPFVLPPGYRFVPYDHELILSYLKPYVKGREPSWPVHHVNIYESNPEQLTEQFEKGNEKEWFFISERTKIQTGGKNLKRSDNGGYWHGTDGAKKVKDRQGVVVGGYKTTLAYYVGKQPNGVKSDWLMTEYTLESSHANEEVDHALCKIYLSPRAVNKKKTKEEENKNHKKEEECVDQEEEVEQPRYVEYQLPHHPLLVPIVDSHQPEPLDIGYHQPYQPQPRYVDLEEEVEQPRYVEYQLPHHPQLLQSTMDSYQPQSHDIGYHQPYQPQPHDVAYQQPQWIHPPPPQGQDSGFGTLTTDDYNNNMLMPSQEDWLDMSDGAYFDFKTLTAEDIKKFMDDFDNDKDVTQHQ